MDWATLTKTVAEDLSKIRWARLSLLIFIIKKDLSTFNHCIQILVLFDKFQLQKSSWFQVSNEEANHVCENLS